MSDRPDLTEHAIEVSMADAMNKAWEVRARDDLSPAAMAAVVLVEARLAAMPSLFRPGLRFTSDRVAQALGDAIGRWAAAATAVAPEKNSPLPAWPGDPSEENCLPH